MSMPIGAKNATGNLTELICDTAGNLKVTQASPSATGQSDVNASSGVVANAAATATLPAAAGKTTYITGFTVTGLGATAAGTALVTVAGITGGTVTYVVAVPAGVGVSINPLVVPFSRPVPASAVNTTIVVSAAAFGAGNTAAAVTAQGYQQ